MSYPLWGDNGYLFISQKVIESRLFKKVTKVTSNQ
jgi:hypothetical protein